MTEPPPPAEIAWLVVAIGVDATLDLLDRFGGSRIYLPKDINQGSALALAIGLEAARAVAAHRPGEGWKVPLAKGWRCRVYRGRGMSQADVARKLSIDESTVARILNPVPARFDQLALDL